MLYNFFKIAFRNLLRHRSHSIINILGLALGITGAILIFLLVKFHLSTDRYHAKADRIYRVVTDLHLEAGNIEYGPGSPYPMGRAIQNDFPHIDTTAFIIRNQALTVEVPATSVNKPNRYLEKEGISFVSPEWFSLFDYQWLAGDPQHALAEPNAVVLTKKWARKYFGRENPVGKILQINNRFTFKVTGLLQNYPENTGTKADMLVSLSTYKIIRPEFPENDWGWIDSNKETFVLLPPDFTAAEFDSAMPAFSRKYHGELDQVYHHHLQPLSDIHFNERYKGVIRKPLLWGLSLVGVFLVVIAGINFVNLATVQSFRRAKEIGVRKVLGSSPAQLFGQFMSETALLIIAATFTSLLLAKVFLPYLNALTNLPLRLNLATDPLLWLFLVVLVLIIILLAGFYPAFVLSGFNPVAALKGQVATPQISMAALRRTLVVTQFVIAQVLLICTLVVANQMKLFRTTDLGFETEAVVMVPLPAQNTSKMEAFHHELKQHAGVRQVSFCFRPPASTTYNGGSFKYHNRPDWEIFPVRSKWADSEYLATFSLKLLAGRNITDRDSTLELLVNEALLRKLQIRDANEIIGKQLIIGELGDKPGKVVGVVSDFNLRSLHTDIDPCVIGNAPQTYQFAAITLQGNNLAATLPVIRDKWQAAYPAEVFEYQFVDEQIARFYATEEMLAKLVQVFTWLAIFISCLGLYGLISFTTAQRTKEIGIRKVLGASSATIIRLLTTDFLRLVLLANIIAWPLAGWAMHRWLQDYAYRTNISWWIFALAGLAAVIIALLTVSYQALKAALANPVKALRNE
ncbi:ABC transporter permease [Adhaeribacter aerolatus]|uniref:ABC transporter permease n=1 Tax=Adhaeribacter aerolatus TaxID=670289 RepID=A0A512B3M3_9BACT|nr:ABC transporter permease [Adhaeribacter aerolatus]GEO06560.1 ABC transporter permease [Adhaeribacter aerolatus]